MSPIAEDDLIGLAAWTIGALGVGARGDGKSALDELCSKIEKHPTLPRPVADRMISDLKAARSAPVSSVGVGPYLPGRIVTSSRKPRPH